MILPFLAPYPEEVAESLINGQRFRNFNYREQGCSLEKAIITPFN